MRWLPVAGYESVYRVSETGIVWSLRRDRLVPAGPGTDGYLYVNLTSGGPRKRRAVHRLVAEAFHGPCPAGMVTRHLDGDRLNNDASNLRWGTQVENARDTVIHRHHWQTVKTHCPQGHPYDSVNTYFWNEGRARKCRACRRSWERARSARLAVGA